MKKIADDVPFPPRPISRHVGSFRGNEVFESFGSVVCEDCHREIPNGELFTRVRVHGRGVHTRIVCSCCEYVRLFPPRQQRKKVYSKRRHGDLHIFYKRPRKNKKHRYQKR